MTKNPFLNALAASTYIVGVVTFIFHIPNTFDHAGGVLMPMAMLSLIVLSVATMGALFFYQPVQLYLDGEKEAAGRLFFRTLAIFAGLTVLIFCALFVSMR